ncbi:MAG: HAD family hydrolase [Candidatus Heimdallarchaeota archaeon]|nr:HAD family hydrolase [Candidatus Heimdallarchaeota archaeon]
MITCLLFDLGNTLYSHTVIYDAWKRVLPHYKIEAEKFLEIFFSTYEKFEGSFTSISKLSRVIELLNLDISIVEELLEAFRAELRKGIRNEILEDKQGTWAFLKSIKEKYKLGILSDNATVVKNEWIEILNSLEMNVFDAIVVSEEIGVEKPAPKIFQVALDKIGVEPKECLFFGDNLKRDIGSESVGMKFIHVYGYCENKSFYKQSIEYINEKNVNDILQKDRS